MCTVVVCVKGMSRMGFPHEKVVAVKINDLVVAAVC